jgi:hypothetical protein
MARSCPVCGGKKFKKIPADPSVARMEACRVCLQCGRESASPKFDYLNGIAALLIAAILLFFLCVDCFAPPRDFWRFTWKGRIAVFASAVALIGIGTKMVVGTSSHR